MPFRSPVSKYIFLSLDNIRHCNSLKLPSYHNFGQVHHVAGNGVDHNVGHVAGHWIGIEGMGVQMVPKSLHCQNWFDLTPPTPQTFGGWIQNTEIQQLSR